MGWSLRKAFRLLPGIKLNLSRRGPRLSVGIPGLLASVGMDGKARIYGGKGPLRYRKDVTLGSALAPSAAGAGWLTLIQRVFGRSK